MNAVCSRRKREASSLYRRPSNGKGKKILEEIRRIRKIPCYEASEEETRERAKDETRSVVWAAFEDNRGVSKAMMIAESIRERGSTPCF
jgi:hypothetical protein